MGKKLVMGEVVEPDIPRGKFMAVRRPRRIEAIYTTENNVDEVIEFVTDRGGVVETRGLDSVLTFMEVSNGGATLEVFRRQVLVYCDDDEAFSTMNVSELETDFDIDFAD